MIDDFPAALQPLWVIFSSSRLWSASSACLVSVCDCPLSLPLEKAFFLASLSLLAVGVSCGMRDGRVRQGEAPAGDRAT